MSVTHHSRIPGLSSFGDYSPLSEAGELVLVAGQFGTDGAGALPAGGDPAEQVRGAFANVGRALAHAGLDFCDVVKFTTFLVGRETVPVFMRTRKEVFAEIYPDGVYPPNTLLLVAGLVEERFVCEIECIAHRGGAR